jgi:predicted exporter
MMRRDPLGVSSRVLDRLLGLTKGLGYRVQIKDGHLLSDDGRQLMMILETSTTATSMAGSEALADHLRDLCASAPSNVEIIPISAAIHTEQNDRLMQHDMNRAAIIDGAAFLLLFVVICRDWRVAAVFLLPIITVGVTIGLCALVYPNLSMIVIGLAATMAGSAVDYGIFVYTAVWLGSDAQADIRRIQRPLIICHLTTLGVFVSLLFSHVPTYRQLGCLTSLSLILSLLAALFVLPAFIRPGGKIMAIRRGITLQQWGRKMVAVTLLGAATIAVGIVLATRVKLDPDITRLDGASAAVKQNEKDFQHDWGRSDTEMAIVVVTGKSRDEAEEANDRINGLLSGHLPEGEFVSLSSFWPSAATRQANQQRWKNFWTPQRIAQLRANLSAAAAPFGFSEDAFNPFFDSLTRPPAENQSREILSSVEEQFIARSANGDWQMLSYFDDTDDNVSAVRKLLGNDADAQVVSRRALGQAFAESTVSEARLLVGISTAFIVISLLVLTRSILKSFIIMLPAIAGIVAMLAVFAMMSLPISVVSVIAAVLVLALASDYGVFAVFAWERQETIFGQAMASMHLSSLTTLAATTAFLFATHPALYLVGVSLTSGLAGGYLTAFLLIPGACFLLEQWRGRRMA